MSRVESDAGPNLRKRTRVDRRRGAPAPVRAHGDAAGSPNMSLSSAQPERLGFGAKLTYGAGSVAFGVASLGLSSALLQPYLNRVIGLPALWVGTAIMISLMLDAVIDPAIGRFSDRLRTPWGRRHPLMYLAIPLVALACYAFWNSPRSWPVETVGIYLICALMALRIAVSLYEVPSQALAPELTADYHERTTLFSYRYFFGVVGGLAMTVLLYQVYLRPENGGILNRDGYGRYGLVAGLVMATSILISSLGTHRRIQRLSHPPVRQTSFNEAMREVFGTLGNVSLVVVMLSGLCSGVATGMSNTLSQYFYIELWGLTPAQISYLAMAGAGASIASIVAAGPVSRAFGKKQAMLGLFSVYLVLANMPLLLKLLGLMPPNGSPWVFRILLADAFLAGVMAITGLIIVSSMVADVVEDAAVRTGVRSEGLLFAANGLLPKFTAGIGAFLGGLVLTLVDFPSHAAPGTVDPALMRQLALVFLPISAGMTALAVGVLAFYRIDQASHERNLATLRATAATADEAHVIEVEPTPASGGG